jgi:hypothetical protein
METIPLKVLVTGCGRSGTHFITSLMQAHGIRVNHECYGPDGTVNWRHAAVGRSKPGFENVFHIYRHPLRTINSFCTAGDGSWRFIGRKIPRLNDACDPVLRAAIYWVEWNQLAENVADISFMVEDIENAGKYLFSRLGVEFDPGLIPIAAKDRDSRTQRESYGNLADISDLASLDEQVHDEVRALMERYGY